MLDYRAYKVHFRSGNTRVLFHVLNMSILGGGRAPHGGVYNVILLYYFYDSINWFFAC